MGRSPCCDKVGLKKGPWTPEEDNKLLAYIEEHGHGSWRALPIKAGLQRCGKSCRLRWTNYLRPDIKRGKFNLQEEQTIIQLHALLGNRWSAIATHLPKRTDNEIKNYWNTHLKKRLAKMGIDPVTHKPKNDSLLSNDGHSKNAANLSHMAQWESARLEAEARLVRQSKLRSSSFKQISSPPDLSSGSTPATKPDPPPRCLDILKAWNGVWPTEAAATESPPTSTVSFSETALPTTNDPTIGNSKTTSMSFYEFVGNSSNSCEGGIMKEEEGEDWNKSFTMSMEISDQWAHEDTLRTCNENVSAGGTESFMERYTDLLLNNSGDRSLSEDGGAESDNGSGGGGCDYYEDNKNYWNSILNLVNSSPSESPMF